MHVGRYRRRVERWRYKKNAPGCCGCAAPPATVTIADCTCVVSPITMHMSWALPDGDLQQNTDLVYQAKPSDVTILTRNPSWYSARLTSASIGGDFRYYMTCGGGQAAFGLQYVTVTGFFGVSGPYAMKAGIAGGANSCGPPFLFTLHDSGAITAWSNPTLSE